jgi:hypothetical protein
VLAKQAARQYRVDFSRQQGLNLSQHRHAVSLSAQCQRRVVKLLLARRDGKSPSLRIERTSSPPPATPALDSPLCGGQWICANCVGKRDHVPRGLTRKPVVVVGRS